MMFYTTKAVDKVDYWYIICPQLWIAMGITLYVVDKEAMEYYI